MPVDPNASLQPGQQYTLSMSASAVAGFLENQSVDSITQQLEASSAVDLAVAIQTNSSPLHPLTYDITFQYTGDGSDTAMDVFQEFSNALSGTFLSWDFISCALGSVPGTGSAAEGVPTLASLTPSSSSLWAIALLALIVIFFMSGGVSVLRHAMQ